MGLMTFDITAVSDGVRAGDYLRAALPDLPESTLRALFASRDVKAGNVRIRKDYVLRVGETLRVYLPDRKEAGSSASLRVVYEDDDVLLVNKPAGISVEADSTPGIPLTELCRLHAEDNGAAAFPPQPCHRLDNRTSGLCLFAKNEKALEILLDVFRSRTLEKYYTCLVRGVMKPPSAECTAFLLKDAERAKVRILDHPLPGARKIVTGYETLESGPVSRLKVHLVTGRTHQIRAHLASLGHPLLGDDLYGDREFNRRMKARSLKLCATSLKLDTSGRLPQLDGLVFTIDPPF